MRLLGQKYTQIKQVHDMWIEYKSINKYGCQFTKGKRLFKGI